MSQEPRKVLVPLGEFAKFSLARAASRATGRRSVPLRLPPPAANPFASIRPRGKNRFWFSENTLDGVCDTCILGALLLARGVNRSRRDGAGGGPCGLGLAP